MSSWRQDPLLKAKYNKIHVHIRSARMPQFTICGKHMRGIRSSTSFPSRATCLLCRRRGIITLK